MKKFLPELTIATILLLYSVTSIHAFSSSSPEGNYNLEGEFGMFGGAKSSDSYKLTDTGGGFAVGFGSSANYGTGSGFQYVLAEVREIIFIISSNTVNLGSLSTTPKGVENTVTVTTNSAGGYQVTVIEDDNLCTSGADCITDVSGGTVDASTEEYGLGTSKAGQYFAQDTDCTNTPFYATAIEGPAQQAASASAPVTNDSTTLCFSAAITDTTEAGSYSHVLTYIATGKF